MEFAVIDIVTSCGRNSSTSRVATTKLNGIHILIAQFKMWDQVKCGCCKGKKQRRTSAAGERINLAFLRYWGFHSSGGGVTEPGKAKIMLCATLDSINVTSDSMGRSSSNVGNPRETASGYVLCAGVCAKGSSSTIIRLVDLIEWTCRVTNRDFQR